MGMWSIFILKHPCRAANFGGGLALATPVSTAGEVHFSNTGPADRWGLISYSERGASSIFIP